MNDQSKVPRGRESNDPNKSRDGSGQGLPQHHHAARDGETRDTAAQRIGFRSYEALVAASTPITGRDGRVHMIVEGPDGHWIVWLEETWPEYRTFDSIHHAGRAAGEETV